MERGFAGPVGRVLQVGSRLSVEQVGGGDVRQRLSGSHGPEVESSGRVPVEIERAELLVAVAQREREHRRQAGAQRSRHEIREPALASQIGHGDGLARVVGREARTFAQLGLQLLEAQGIVV